MADTLRQDQRIDLVAFDKHDLPVLAVEVKALADVSQVAIQWIVRLESELRLNDRPIPYWMFVDLDCIILMFFEDETRMFRIERSFITAHALSAYDPEFEQKRIFDDYLLALVEAWLRDFVFEWRLAAPPLKNELAGIGLAERLRGGSTHREVTFADLDPVRRNQFRDEPFPGARSSD